MDKKLEHLKESMNHTVLKGLEFSEDRKREVFKTLKSKRRHNRFKWLPKSASVKAAWSVLACTVLLVGCLYFAFSTIKDDVHGTIIRSGKSMFSSDKKNGEPTYIIYFNTPETFSDIASLQRNIPFKLVALKYSFPLGNRFPESGTYKVEHNEPITVAATSAENQLKKKLKNDIRDLEQKVSNIKTEKQLSLEKPMLNDVIGLMELKKGLLKKVDDNSIHFSSIVISINNTGWMNKLKNTEGVAGIEPYQPNQSPIDEPYPTDKVVPNYMDKLPTEPIYTMADTDNGDVWAYSYHHLYRSSDYGVRWNEIKTLTLNGGTISNADFVEGKYIKLYVTENGLSYMYMSADDGETWTKNLTPFNGTGHLYFLNSLTGWYLEETGVYNNQSSNRLYKTDDGGVHWSLIAQSNTLSDQDSAIPTNGVKTNLTFIDDQNGWMTANEPSGTNAYLYQTTDGGKTWTSVFINTPSDYLKTQKSVQGPYFFDRKNGFFVLNARNISDGHSAFVFYETSDGGRSWKMTQPMEYPNIQEVSIDITDDEAYVTDGKTLYETNDMGNTWIKNGMVFDGQSNRVVSPLSLNMIDDNHSVLLIREMANMTRALFSIGEVSHWQTVNVPSIDNSKE